jgi:hypothetical protein
MKKFNFFFFFSCFFDRATARAAETILIIDGLNDVMSLEVNPRTFIVGAL